MALNPANLAPGCEQHEKFRPACFKGKQTRIQYDYRTVYGELFSCVARSLEAARAQRDTWLSQQLDVITREVSAFSNFAELVDSDHHYEADGTRKYNGYRPTILADKGPRLVFLADAYDLYKSAQGSDRRAYRG